MAIPGKSDVSVCVLTRDELPFLRECLPRALKHCDELVVADTGSTDGSQDYIKEVLRPNDIFVQVPAYMVPEYGFGWVRQQVAEQATKTWVHFLDADEYLSPSSIDEYRRVLAETTRDVIQIITATPEARSELVGKSWDEIVNAGTRTLFEVHRRIYRRESGIEWRGYIHEELFLGPCNAAHLAERTKITHNHLKWYRNFGDPQVKWSRYAWMICRAMQEPALRAWTNPYWYSTYAPEHLKLLQEQAAKYEELLPDGRRVDNDTRDIDISDGVDFIDSKG